MDGWMNGWYQNEQNDNDPRERVVLSQDFPSKDPLDNRATLEARSSNITVMSHHISDP